jgi:hypothetical protein
LDLPASRGACVDIGSRCGTSPVLPDRKRTPPVAGRELQTQRMNQGVPSPPTDPRPGRQTPVHTAHAVSRKQASKKRFVVSTAFTPRPWGQVTLNNPSAFLARAALFRVLFFSMNRRSHDHGQGRSRSPRHP